CLEVTAVSEEGYVMALRHRTFDVRGIQFHPESVLTPDGKTLLKNWLNLSNEPTDFTTIPSTIQP
ncbi:MAG: hypothetical protein PUD47_05405, partial [Bacteroidales bacterium]|nr:hypothetical protein [Bacteroidales bacterium]